MSITIEATVSLEERINTLGENEKIPLVQESEIFTFYSNTPVFIEIEKTSEIISNIQKSKFVLLQKITAAGLKLLFADEEKKSGAKGTQIFIPMRNVVCIYH